MTSLRDVYENGKQSSSQRRYWEANNIIIRTANKNQGLIKVIECQGVYIDMYDNKMIWYVLLDACVFGIY